MIRFLQSGNKAAKYILGGFLVILALSMVAYLIPGFMTDTQGSGRPGVVAKVAGEDIRSDEVTKLAQAQMRSQRVPDFYVPILMNQAVQQLIQRQEVRYEAARLGLTASDQEVRDELENGAYKQYFFPDGKWIGQEKYQELVTQGGGTVADFERSVKDDLLTRKLFNTIAAGVTVSPTEVEQAYKDKNIKVKFQYAILNLEDVQKQIKPTEAELKAFYQANQARYQNSIPEKRKIRYFVLLDKDVESKVTLDPAELQRYYNSHLDDYRLPDRVKVRHILIPTPASGPDGKPDQKAVDAARAKAADILKQIKAGGDFAELAKKNSQDPGSAAKGGELGWIVKGQTVPEFEKMAFAQNPGQISDPVQTSYGFHIIQTEEKEQAHIKPLADIKAEIEKNLKGGKVGTLLEQKGNAAQDAAQKQGLDKAAAQNGAQVVESNPVGRNEALPGIGPAPELMNEVFAAEEKSAPQLARFPQGYVVYQVARIDTARTPSFEEIKERVANDFKSQRASELLQKKARELADRAHAEHDLAKAAKEAGAMVKSSELVGRTSQVPDLGAMSGAAGAAFNLKPGEISDPVNLGQKAAVLELTERQDPSLTGPQFVQQRDGLQEQISQRKKQQALELFINTLNVRLEKEGKLKVYKNEMDLLTKSRG
jgi:peptidyl-prolyl cis-trans isomerase D